MIPEEDRCGGSTHGSAMISKQSIRFRSECKLRSELQEIVLDLAVSNCKRDTCLGDINWDRSVKILE